jgi:hypothetical protein
VVRYRFGGLAEGGYTGIRFPSGTLARVVYDNAVY